jgi:hypothetical protein
MFPSVPPLWEEKKPIVDKPTPTQSQLEIVQKEIKMLESIRIDILLFLIYYTKKR